MIHKFNRANVNVDLAAHNVWQHGLDHRHYQPRYRPPTKEEQVKGTDREGARFEVICKRCGKRFTVIRNWGGGIRRADNEKSNPAICDCGSRQLEVY